MKTNNLYFVLIISVLASCSANNESDPSQAQRDTATVAVNEPENLTATESALVYGIDISKYQGDESAILDTKKDSLSFVICRATQGFTYVDPDFHSNWTTITEKGFVGGAYHFYMSGDSPSSQANHFLSVFKAVGEDHFPPIIDFEGGGIQSGAEPAKVESDLLTFLQLIEEKTNRVPIIYTNHSTGSKYLTASDFAKYPLWIADYSNNEEPHLPSIWEDKGWILWQKTDSYMIANIKNDFDVFKGSKDDLTAFIKQSN